MHACFTEFVSAVFRTRNIHTRFHPFIYVRLVISVCLSLHLCECLRAPFLEREIFTHFICLFMFVLAAWVFGGFVMFVGVVFKTRNIHIPFRLFIVMVCHEASRIIAIRDGSYLPGDPSRSVVQRHPFCDLLRIGCIGHVCV